MLFPVNHFSNVAQQSPYTETAVVVWQALCFQFICRTLGSFGSSAEVTFVYGHFRSIHTTSLNCNTTAFHCHVFINFQFLKAFPIIICKLLTFIEISELEEKLHAKDS